MRLHVVVAIVVIAACVTSVTAYECAKKLPSRHKEKADGTEFACEVEAGPFQVLMPGTTTFEAVNGLVFRPRDDTTADGVSDEDGCRIDIIKTTDPALVPPQKGSFFFVAESKLSAHKDLRVKENHLCCYEDSLPAKDDDGEDIEIPLTKCGRAKNSAVRYVHFRIGH